MVGQQQGLWSSYSSSIITQIVQNIQVTTQLRNTFNTYVIQIKIENVSVSFKDPDILDNRSIGTTIKMVDVSNLVNDNLQSTKKLELLDLSVYWNYNYANEYILKPVKADVIITKDKNHAPLQVYTLHVHLSYFLRP